MSPPDSPARSAPPAPAGRPGAPGIPGPRGSRYGWFVGVLALIIIALISVNTLSTAPNGSAGLSPGKAMPPFAAPLALGSLNRDANFATAANQGSRGKHPACAERGPEILNVCQLYERGPVVLAMFVNKNSCPAVLDDLQSVQASYPGVQFAAVALRPDRGHLRSTIAKHGWTFPIGVDRDGAVFNLYRVTTCPQLTFARPGGVVAEPALLSRPTLVTLRERIDQLVASARAGGWRPPA